MKKGMTLLEVLISLTIFAFTALYISRVFNKSLKQKIELDRDIKSQRIISNILDVLNQDLMSSILTSDISYELNSLYSVNNQDNDLLQNSNNLKNQNLRSINFNFEGKKDKLTFMTFSRNPANPKEYQVIKVDYFLQNCTPPNKTKSSQCLMRGVSLYWKNLEDTSKMKTNILFENINAFQFSYYNSVEGEWMDEWNFVNTDTDIKRSPDLNHTILPSALKLKMEMDSKKPAKINITFPISHPFLRTHRTQYLTPFIHLKKLKTPSKNKKEEGSK